MDREASAHDLLVDILLDESKDPTSFPMGLLESITNDFSDDQKIGSGGFADVYKGHLQGGTVAVKKLKQQLETDEMKFVQEVDSLMKVKHKNIVRFLGYCSDTQGKIWELKGKNIMAEERQRFLCFEFLSEGSLDKHISDASSGLEWRTRYHVIKGICEGLHYLHGKKIVHSDLKPENILLDHDMVPKICDFGIARSFHDEQTSIITQNLVGTRYYMAPESFDGLITLKSDIYSLGIIITEILTGQKYGLSIENVHENWNARFKTSDGDTWLEHVRVCAEIGLECTDFDPKKRPTIGHIIDMLAELEQYYGLCETNRSATQVFDVYPLDIWFPLKTSDKIIKYPVSLINKTDDLTGVWITPTSLHACSNPDYPYVWEPKDRRDDLESSLFIRLKPHSSDIIYMTMRKKKHLTLQADKGMFKVVMVATKSEEDLKCLYEQWKGHGRTWRYEDPFPRARDFRTVHQATLRVGVTNDPARCQEVETHQYIQTGKDDVIRCTDVHPTETWLLVGYSSGWGVSASISISIRNYETQETIIRFGATDLQGFKYGDREILLGGGATAQPPRASGWVRRKTSKEKFKEKCYNLLGKCFLRNDDRPGSENLEHVYRRPLGVATRVSPQILSIKFIAGEQWFALGDDDGCVHVYDYTSPTGKNRVTTFEAHVAKGVHFMVVQPEHTLLLTGSSWYDETTFKLWNWSKGWTFARGIKRRGCMLDYSIFASTDLIKACDRPSDGITTVEGVRLAFCTDSTHRDILAYVPRFSDCVKVLDLQTEKHVHSLYPGTDSIRDLACHPTLPILAGIMTVSGFHMYQIVLWHFRTFRVMKRVELPVKGTHYSMVFDGREDITRLVVATDKEISVIKINVAALLTGSATLI